MTNSNWYLVIKIIFWLILFFHSLMVITWQNQAKVAAPTLIAPTKKLATQGRGYERGRQRIRAGATPTRGGAWVVVDEPRQWLVTSPSLQDYYEEVDKINEDIMEQEEVASVRGAILSMSFKMVFSRCFLFWVDWPLLEPLMLYLLISF